MDYIDYELKRYLLIIHDITSLIFDNEKEILRLLNQKYSLSLNNEDLEKRKELTELINEYIKLGIKENEKQYQILPSYLEKMIRRDFFYYKHTPEFFEDIYKRIHKYISPEGVPTYINFLLSIGFPFDLEYITEENFNELILEFNQTPDFIEWENKRNNFVNNFFIPLENKLGINSKKYFLKFCPNVDDSTNHNR